METHERRGAAAESLAADYLRTQGLAVLARNLRCNMGELDIVCLDREVLVIVEVRQRACAAYGDSLASVTRRKQCRLIRAARFHCQRDPAWRDRVVRFDVIGLDGVISRDGAPALTWIKDAFREN